MEEHLDVKFNLKGENPIMDKEMEGIFFKVKWFLEERIEGGKTVEQALEEMVAKYKIDGQIFLEWWKKEKEKEQKKLETKVEEKKNPPISAATEFLTLSQTIDKTKALETVSKHYEEKHGCQLPMEEFNELVKKVEEKIKDQEKVPTIRKKKFQRKYRKWTADELSRMWWNK